MQVNNEGKSYNPHLEVIIILKILRIGGVIFYSKNFTHRNLIFTTTE